MSSVDERIVKMHFDNAAFEAAAAKTMATLKNLDQSIKNIGATNGLGGITKAANNINLSGLTSALDKLKEKLGFDGTKSFNDIDSAANKVNFSSFGSAIDNIKTRLTGFLDAPSRALDFFKEKLGFKGAEEGFNNIETAANKVHLTGASNAADTLARKLQFPGAETGFSEIERASGKVHFAGISNALSSIEAHFSTLTVVATSALATITSKATSAGFSLVKSLSIGPIIDGFQEYATNLNSIQTILANTQFSGTNLSDVNKALNQLNHYSDQTIYNFSQMAKNIGTFTAAGVDLDKSVASIKGIANLAALSGSSAEQASSAMYQLSQAIASGRVSLQDWNSVVNAGMGGATFQRALAQTAQAMGTVADGAVKIDKATGKATINGQSFRESITAKPGEQSWLTSDVLTSTLEQFTGDLSKAQLAAMGFNDEQIKSIQQTAITAKKAATEVKTLSGVFNVAKEAIGSGWAQTFQEIFGDFNESKTLFTNLSNSINTFIGTNAKARNDVLADWKELGGRTELIKGIKNVFVDLKDALAPVHDAFREIFPRKTGQDLFDLTTRFENFTEKLKMGPEIVHNVKRTFSGLFAAFDIGKQIIQGVASVFGDLFGAVFSGSGGILNFTGTIGDFIVSIDKALKRGDALKHFFDGLGQVLATPIALLSQLAGAIGSLFSTGTDSSGVSSSMDDMTNSLNPLSQALSGVNKAWQGFIDLLGQLGDKLGPAVSKIGHAFGGIGDAIANSINTGDFEKVFNIIQTTLIGGIFLAIKKGFGKGVNINLGGGVLKNLSETLGTVTGSLKAMQRNINAGTLVKIAAAMGVLSAAILVLSTIDPKKLAAAMTAVSVGLGELIAAMALLNKGAGATAFLRMPFIAGSMILLAAAIDTLAIAVKVFSKMNWEELAKGLIGVGGALVAVGLGVQAIPPSALLIAPGLLAIGVALNLLALSMKIFATMKWEEIGKGLIGIGAGLTAVGIGSKFIGPQILLIGPGLIALATGLNILALAVMAFGSMNLETLAKGIGGIALALVAIGLAIKTIPPTVALQAAGLVVLGVALTEISAAVAIMGGMSIGNLAKGIAGLGVSLVVLAGGLRLMSGTIPGAIALTAAATGLAILTPVLGVLGNMKFTTIAKGLAVIGISLGVLAVAGTFAAPGITALGLAMIPFAGAAVLAAGAVYLFAKGLSLLGGEGSKGITAVLVAFTAFVAAFPGLVITFLKGLVDIAESIASLAPKVVDAMIKITEALIAVVIRAAPDMAKAVVALIKAFLTVLTQSAPEIINAGFSLLLSFLSGISDNIGEVIKQTGNIIVHFLNAVAAELPNIVKSGANMLIQFLSGIASKFPEMITAGANALVSFLNGVTQNIPRVTTAAINMISAFINAVADNIFKLIDSGARMIGKILEGIGNRIDDVAKAAVRMISKFFDSAVEASIELEKAGARAVINFINGISKEIPKQSGALGEAGANLGIALVEGAIRGMGSMVGALVKKAISVFDSIPGAVRKLFDSHSPSRVFADIGKDVMLGMMAGIDENAPRAIRSMESMSEDIINSLTNSLNKVPNVLNGLVDMNPVVTPVLDLTAIKKEAKNIGDISNVIPITAAISYNQANAISAAQQLVAASIEPPAVPVQDIKFEQNNYSPEALTLAEIYRQTNNQLSQAKSALGIA